MTNQAERYQIYNHMTRTKFIAFEDALDIGKIRIFIGEYEKGKGASTTAYHFIDLDDARVLLADLAWGKPVKWADFKGGEGSNGRTISRVMTVKTDDERTHVWVEVKNGPGARTATGAVKPAGKPFSEIAIPLTVDDARRLAMAVQAYITAREVAQAVLREMEKAA